MSKFQTLKLSGTAPNPLVDAYTRAARRIRQDGVLRGSAHLLAELARKVVRYDCVYLFSKAKNEPLSSEAVSRLTGVVVREAGRKDIIRFESCRLSDKAHYRMKALESFSRLKAGYKCFLAVYEGRLIAKAWIAGVDTWFISEIESNEKIGADSIIIFDCATMPEYRGKRIFPLMLRYIINKYSAQRKVIYCEKWNVSSRRGIEHDFTLEKKLYFFKMLMIAFRWSQALETSVVDRLLA